MDASTQIEQYAEFLETNYHDELLDSIRRGKKSLVVEFSKISRYSPELAEKTLEEPEEAIKAAELAIKNFDLKGDLKNFTIRLRNLPESQKIAIRDIRSKHIGKLLEMEGIVRQKSDVRPQVISAKFECPSCGQIHNLLQLDSKFKEPSRCSCGRKGKFRLLDKELVDAQKIVLEEAPEDLDGGDQPKRLDIFLKNDLVSPITEKKTNPGSRVKVTGRIEEVPIPAREGGKLTRFDLMLETNNIEPVQEEFQQLDISEEERKEIEELSKDPEIYEKLVSSLAPSTFGHEQTKEALLLQLFGGVQKKRSDGVTTRGDFHVLLVGDPGSGKSQLLKRVTKIAPKARYVSGKGASAAGLTATVVKDEFLRGYALEAGVLVLANKGIAAIDELDKMSPEDRGAMHEALEQQSVTISKANIHATLRCETTVLAAANPKFGRFDQYELLAKQIDLPSTLINRFDLIFPIKDLPDQHRDEKMASFILELHKKSETEKPELATETIKKYIGYAKRTCTPKLTEEALNEIKKYYVNMRNSGGEGEVKAIPISARQLEGLVRLSEASARTRLDSKVRKKDARRAIELMHYCLTQIGMDFETGKIDIDRIGTGITASQRSHIGTVKEVINELEKLVGKQIPEEDIVRECENRGISEEKTHDILKNLGRIGDIFYPKHGVVSKV